jgi:hypothetical protein
MRRSGEFAILRVTEAMPGADGGAVDRLDADGDWDEE